MISDRAEQPRARSTSLRVAAAPVLMLLAALVVVAAGCGGSSDTKANDAYANSVCGAIGSWEQQVKSIATNLSGGLAKASLQTKVAQVKSATQTLATQIKAIPPPSTSDGQAAKQQLDQLSSDVTTTANAAKSAAAQIPPNASAATIASSLLALGPQVKSLASTAQSTVKSLKTASGSLSSAFKSADSCKSLGG